MKLKISKNDLWLAAALLLAVIVLMYGQYLFLTINRPLIETAEKLPPAPVSEIVLPSFDVIRVTRDGRAVIAGRAPAGAEVTLSNGDKVIGNVIADKRGDWVLIPELPLQPGSQVLSLSSRLGVESPQASIDSAIINVPARPDGDVFVAVSRLGKPTRIIAQGLAPITKAEGVQLAGIDLAPDGTALLSGHASPGRLVRVYIDNSVAGDAVAAGDGAWSLSYAAGLGAGAHLLRADQIDDAGKVTLRAEAAFGRSPEGRISLGDQKVVVLQGSHLWEIARRVYGQGTAYSIIFTGNQEQIRDPNLIYPGQEFRMPAPPETIAPTGPVHNSHTQ